MSILDQIFATKRQEVATAKREHPIDSLRSRLNDIPVLPFAATLALSGHPVSLIAEVKKASPSQGTIREDFDPVALAAQYRDAGADCLSVLTDVDYFQGSPGFLTDVKKEIGLPCLRKDFLYDPYQLYEARFWGADAVLLIAAALQRSQISDLKHEAEDLGMDAFLEVHNENEAEMACDLKFTLVGVNNRDLSTFTTDLGTSEQLIPILRQGLPEAVVVSESAISSHSEVQRVQQSGARSVLIGTTFSGSADVTSKIKEVMAW